MIEPRRVIDLLDEHRVLTESVASSLSADIAEVAELVAATVLADRGLFFCGNGGSAADAQHLAAEYVVRFRRDRRPFRALAFTTDTSVLTAAANDVGFDTVFERQVRAWCRKGDVIFLHSTSGRSPNVLRAAEAAAEAGVTTVAMLGGDGGPLRDLVDHALVVPTESTARAQEMHMLIGHIVCDLAETSVVTAETAGASAAASADASGAAEASVNAQFQADPTAGAVSEE